MASKELTYQGVNGALKGVRLIPVTSTRSDILRCTDQLDALKATGQVCMPKEARKRCERGL